MAEDVPSEHAPTPTPHPSEKGKIKAAAPTPIPTPAPAPPTAQPHAQAPKKAKAQAPPPTPPAPATYTKAMAPMPKPKPTTRPSVMVHLHHTSLLMTLRKIANTQAPCLVTACNEVLTSKAHYASVQVSAAKWAPLGNLVVFTGPDTNLTQLQTTHHLIVLAIEAALPQPTLLTSHPNIKWSKLLINAVPTRVTASAPAHSCEECHQALLCDNPSYRCLHVTQLPSWVRKPSLYMPHSSSSLVISFEDPNGSTLFSILSTRHLFRFGAQLAVCKWHQPPPSMTKQEAAQKCHQQRLTTQAHEEATACKAGPPPPSASSPGTPPPPLASRTPAPALPSVPASTQGHHKKRKMAHLPSGV
jgi:hypothetical protein